MMDFTRKKHKKITYVMLIIFLFSILPANFIFADSSPKITGISPSEGTTAGGTEVRIEGENFSSNAKVKFGGVDGRVTSVEGDGTIIIVETPPYKGDWAEGTQEKPVSVVVTSSGIDTTAPEEFKYIPSDPAIDSVTPDEGTAGDEITIDGKEFIDGALVVIGGVNSPRVTFIDSTLIKAVVPALASGEKRIRVTNPDRQTVVWEDTFTYKKSVPSITRVEPSKGPVDTETRISIFGDNFVAGLYEEGEDKGKPITRVFFGDEEGIDVEVHTQQEIRVTTPKVSEKGRYYIRVNVDGVNATRQNAFEFISNPTITEIDPREGSVLGGDTITIRGSDFQQGINVYFGTKRASRVDRRTSEVIEVVTPPYDTPGKVEVRVVNTDGGEATTTEGNHYEYTQSKPRISSVQPNEGSVIGGTDIVVTGENFRSGVKLYIDGIEVKDLKRINEERLTGETPRNNREGSKDVRVVNPDRGEYILSDGFTYTRSEPKIIKVEPDNCTTVAQKLIKITGKNFISGAEVKIGDKLATEVNVEEIEGSDETIITARVPEGTPGRHLITVTNEDEGQAKYEYFTYTESRPKIIEGPVNVDIYELLSEDELAGAALNTGSTYGGTVIEIEGEEFSHNVRVYIGGRPATNITVEKKFLDGSNSDRHIIRAKTPPGELGERPLIIINPDEMQTETTFQYIKTPTITSITPNKGCTEGGDEIIITGSGFNTGAEGVKLFIGGVNVPELNIKSSTEITATTPGNSDGKKDVVIINMNDLGSYRFSEGFTYELPPSSPIIESIQPETGPVSGGNEIEIKGIDLRSGIKVYFGDEIAEVVNIETIEENGTTKNIVRCIAPANISGEVDVKVVNHDGNSYIVENGYTYKIPERALTVSSITPSSGLDEGDTFVTIRGTNFIKPVRVSTIDGTIIYKTTNITIGGNDIKNLIVEDSRKITGYTPGGPEGSHDVIVKIVHVKGDMREDGSLEIEEEISIKESVRLKNGFTYKLPQSEPIIEEITPSEGPTSGGTSVIITGEDFIDGAEVYFGDYTDNRNKAPVVNVISPTKIEAYTPSTTRVGVRDVYVVNPDEGRAVYEDGFIYRGNVLIAVSITPNLGTVSGNVYATIKGANFIEGTKVNIGDEAATNVTVIDPETITLSTPANTIGAKDVIVYNQFGESRIRNGFLYYMDQSSPYITHLLPNEGTSAGGEEVEIHGQDFRSDAMITFAGISALDVFAESPNLIRATTPPGIPGTVDVGITNTDGGSYVLRDGFTYISNPIIEDIFPNRGSINHEIPVTITGANFDPELKVYVDEEEVSYCRIVDDTTIKIRMPIRQSTGYADIVVRNPDSGEFTVRNGFRYMSPDEDDIPKINEFGIIPDRGTVEGGTVITINGRNFKEDAIIVIGDNLATNVKVENSTTITAITPPGTEGKKDVFVINLLSTGQAMVEDGFEYMTPSSRPTISSIIPNEGTIYGGTDIIISGTDFRKGASVIIGGNKAEKVEVVSPIKIRAVTPPGEHGKKNVTVMNTDAGSATTIGGFEYKAPKTEPEIHNIKPTKGSAHGGTFVTIRGKNFVSGASVVFGGEPAQDVRVVDSATITVYTPPYIIEEGEEIVVDVAVTNPDTGLARWEDCFTYVIPDSSPVIDTIAPEKGTIDGETFITVKGEDFRKGIKLLIDGNEAEVVKIEDDKGNIVGDIIDDDIAVISGTIITAITPPGTLGKKDVIVENEDTGTYLKRDGFEYVLTQTELTIESIDPDEGTVFGGTPITIIGEGFVEDAKVFIGGVETKETEVIDEYTIKARTGPNTPGVKNVTVQNPDGSTATLENSFEYKEPITNPKIAFLDPDKGPIYGEIEVAIIGENFEPWPRVFVGQEEAEVISVTSGQIRIILPENTAGPKDVIVINPDTGLAHLEEGFLYLEYPRILEIEPDEGPLAGETRVVITGEYFSEGAKVIFGENEAENVQVHSPTIISAITPEGDETGFVDVKVINRDGGEGILANGYYYIAPRTVPLPPEGFSAYGYDSITIELTWEPSEHADYYEIFASKTGRSDSYKFLERTDRTRFFVTDLEPRTRYYFKVRAVNELGSSDFSKSDYASTDRRRPGDSQYDDKLEGIVVAHEGDSQIFTIYNTSDLKYSSELHIEEDFRRLTRKEIVITYDAIYDLSRDLVIKTSGLNLTIPRTDLKRNLGNIRRNEREVSGVRIIIEKADKRLTDQMLRSLPRGTKTFSDIYKINMETQISKEIKEHLIFGLKLDMLYDYEDFVKHNENTIVLSYYNEFDGKFMEIGKMTGHYVYGVFNSNIIMPGYYLLTIE